MKKKKSYLIVGIIIVVGLVADLLTKAIFANLLKQGEIDIEVIPNFMKFTYVENDGAAYGMFGGKSWLLILLTVVFIIGFICYYIFNHSTSWWYTFGIGMILSGALGNLVDRVLFNGIVRDFISIEIFNFIFNLADVWITFGVICFAIFVVMEIIKDAKDKKGKSVNDTSNK